MAAILNHGRHHFFCAAIGTIECWTTPLLCQRSPHASTKATPRKAFRTCGVIKLNARAHTEYERSNVNVVLVGLDYTWDEARPGAISNMRKLT
jgi:hypothetical protein